MRPTILRYLTVFVAAAAAGLLIQGIFFETFQTPNSVMAPTLTPHRTYVIEKWPYVFGNPIPPPGEVLVYDALSDLSATDRAPFVKRVVAGPGDRVEVRAGRLRINGVDATYAPDSSDGESQSAGGPNQTRFVETLPSGHSHLVSLATPLVESSGVVRVPKDSVFVIQDVRQAGLSSASPGQITTHSIRGRVRRFCFPWTKAHGNSLNLGCPLQGSFSKNTSSPRQISPETKSEY